MGETGFLQRIMHGLKRRGSFLFQVLSNHIRTSCSGYQPVRSDVTLDVEHLALPLTVIDPAKNELLVNPDFMPDSLSYAGIPFISSPYYSFAKEFYTNPNFDYKGTEYFNRITKGTFPVPAKGVQKAESCCKRFIYLLKKVKDEGFQTNSAHPILLAPLVDGRFIVINGKHRVAALLALDKTPFQAAVAFENELLIILNKLRELSLPRKFYSRSLQLLEKIGQPAASNQNDIAALISKIRNSKLESWADIYHPIPFYEFRTLTTQVTPQASYNRLGEILKHRPGAAQGKVLDLGCNVGFYSFSLARRGADVRGIDLRKEYINIANRIAALYNSSARFECEAITPETVRKEEGQYDTVFLFSALQWVIDQNGMEYGREVLRAISEKSESLFFDIPVNEGKACMKCSPGEEIFFTYNLLRESTSFGHIEHIADINTYITDTRHLFYCHH